MTKVCDCENAEKAYLIINPDSPDRQEILSLNPPICREIKTILSIDGDVFIGSQALDPNNPYTVGIFEPEGTTGGWVKWSVYYFGLAIGYVYKPKHVNVVINGRYHIFGEGSWDGRYCRFGAAAAAGGTYPGYGHSMTNAGRPYTIEPAGFIPDCTPEVCGLTINYLDGSTFDYGEVPCDVDITKFETLEISDNSGILKTIDPYGGEPLAFQCGDRECPPETCCNPCAGSALNCCYDENGRLIDSFIRRT
ncbi:hypothetical protein Lepto7376_3725 [[Leptolyngbya] sp. PCC 7376]|uniref:hypothetical protein n=1 Tax=[Leptolyngbya] sp. PCC 7376 TaxID=111781 RepID=UPI00029EFFFC|nr:hypothetical protein [[Leptolyngbya] sp. PCC 7376]AFY39901.1 hypothetical protein Lepto7376_3725 [[Leptolyngbya] sp. PCC 7376]